MCSFSLSLASHPCSNQAPCFTKALRNAWKLLELTLPENSNFGSLEDSHLTNPRFLHPLWYYLVCQICNYSIICFNHKHESCYWLSTRSRAFWIFIVSQNMMNWNHLMMSLYLKLEWPRVEWVTVSLYLSVNSSNCVLLPDSDLSSTFSHLGGYKGIVRASLALEEFGIFFRWQMNMDETVSST